ncbi:MAG: hypothetical protein QOF24_872 [Verrucomicrobiota bacterium]|jgi:hypothetical protein
MTDNQDTSHHDDSPISGGVVAIAQRILAKTLQTSGNRKLERIGDLIREWPERVGGVAGQILGKILGSAEKGEAIAVEDKEALNKALENQPEAAAMILGFLTADLLTGASDAESERNALLEYYQSSLNLICTAMANRTTSFALRGFLHQKNCISYWHFERPNLTFSRGKDYLFPNGLDVYFIEENPTDEELLRLNLLIRDDPERHLDRTFYNIEKNDNISELAYIYETTIATKKLDPDRNNTRDPQPNSLGFLATDHSKPIQFTSPIPPEPELVVALIESLQIAIEAQDFRPRQAQEARKQLADKVPKTP